MSRSPSLPDLGGNPAIAEIHRGRQENRMQQTQDFAEQKYSTERETSAFTAMLKDPQNAQYIAQQYGVPFTPEVQQLLQQPELAQLTLNGYKLAQQAGLDRYGATKDFVTAYVENNGDPMAAMEAVGDFTSVKEQNADTARINANRPRGNPPRTGPQPGSNTGLPKGFIWGPDGKTPQRVIDPTTGKPFAASAYYKPDDTYYGDDVTEPDMPPPAGGAPAPAAGGGGKPVLTPDMIKDPALRAQFIRRYGGKPGAAPAPSPAPVQLNDGNMPSELPPLDQELMKYEE